MRDIKYIIKRVIIGVLIVFSIMFIKEEIPHAEVVSINAFASGTYLKPGVNIGTYGSYINMRVDFLGYAEGIEDPTSPMYVSLAVCRTWAAPGIDGNSQYTNAQSYGVQNTNIKCPFANSEYGLTGFVSIYTYKLYGGGSYNLTEFKVYTALNTSGTYYTDMQLIDLSVSPNQFKSSNDYAYLGEIVNSNNIFNAVNNLNSSISNSTTTIINNQNSNTTSTNNLINATNQLLDEEFTIVGNDRDTREIEEWLDDFNSDTYGLTSIITAPLSTIESLTSSTCTALTVPLPFVNEDITLPCMSTIYNNTFGSAFTLYQTITTALIGYWCIVRMFAIVKGMKDPNDDKIEVVDL